MPKELILTIMLISVALPVISFVQLFDKNIGEKLSILSTIKSLVIEENNLGNSNQITLNSLALTLIIRYGKS